MYNCFQGCYLDLFSQNNLPFECNFPLRNGVSCSVKCVEPFWLRGLRPLDPHRGIAPGPHQGPLKQAPESPAVRHDSSARCTLQVSLFPVFKMLAGMLQGISPN